MGEFRKRTRGNVRRYKDYFIVQNRKTKKITYAPIELVGHKTLDLVKDYRGDVALKKWKKNRKK